MPRKPYKTIICLNCNKETRYKVGKIYCGHLCQRDAEYKTKILEWLNNSWDGNVANGTSGFVKRYIKLKYNNKCSCCNISEWQGKAIHLVVDHIDGDAFNSSENNLRLLCPNCHSQTDTYAGRNKGKGTRIYRNKYDKKYAIIKSQHNSAVE